MEDYRSNFFDNLFKIYADMDNSHPDLTLHCVADGTHLKCHTVILSACSEYFKNAFFVWNCAASSSTRVLDVHEGVTGETMKILLKFAYSGKIKLTQENVTDVLAAANFFSIQHVVDKCAEFILKNLNLEVCVELLQFSWQLDLAELTSVILSYVAENFSSLEGRLLTLPVKLVALVLASDYLIARDKITNLPTPPVEREKQVLDFILSFTRRSENFENSENSGNSENSENSENSKNSEKCSPSNDDIDVLLSCVKWCYFTAFNEQHYVFNQFAPVLAEGRMQKDIRKRLEDADTLSNCTTRAFSFSELVWTSVMSADTPCTDNPTPFRLVAQPNEHITQIDLISRLWNRGRLSTTVIGGLRIYVASPGSDPVCHCFGIAEEDGYKVSLSYCMYLFVLRRKHKIWIQLEKRVQ